MTDHKRGTRHPQAAGAARILERNRLDEAPPRVTSSEHCLGEAPSSLSATRPPCTSVHSWKSSWSVPAGCGRQEGQLGKL